MADGYAIYPQGGCSALDHGGVPKRPGVAVDTRALCRVVDYPAADMTVTVEAGITLAGLQSVLSLENQRVLIEAPSPEVATLGGIYATNTSGPRRFGAGRPRDQIIGVSFVTSDGALVKGGGRVVKNVAGYALPKFLTGSMGTLGVIVQLTLKVRPKPEASALVWTVFDSTQGAAFFLDGLNASETRPMAVELLNAQAASALTGEVGLPNGPWVVVVGVEGSESSVAWQVDRLRKSGSEVVEVERVEALWASLAGFQAHAAGPVTILANVRPSSVAGFAAALDPGVWSVQAHAGNGIVRAHAIGALGLDELVRPVDEARARAVFDGGNLVLTRCPTAWKARLKVWGEPRPDWALCERLKHALDPAGAMNPGRFVGRI